jgi:hypothetical protein
MHEDVPDPAAVLGKVLEEFMEVDNQYKAEEQETGRVRILETLSGVNYFFGLTTTISPYQRQLRCSSQARGEAPPPASLFAWKKH